MADTMEFDAEGRQRRSEAQAARIAGIKKRTAQRRSPYTEGAILILLEKHDRRYFDVSSPEKAAKVALKILGQRLQDGYWYGTFEDWRDPDPIDLTEESIASLPVSIQASARGKLKAHKVVLEEAAKGREFLEDARFACANQDGELALYLLHQRDSYEYEGLALEYLEKV